MPWLIATCTYKQARSRHGIIRHTPTTSPSRPRGVFREGAARFESPSPSDDALAWYNSELAESRNCWGVLVSVAIVDRSMFAYVQDVPCDEEVDLPLILLRSTSVNRCMWRRPSSTAMNAQSEEDAGAH